MEARFGYDFSGVCVHDDARAAAAAAGINAAAFTVGQDIVFGAGRYSPATARGRELLAHELAHTIQQRGARAKAPPVAPGSALETRAADAGRAAASGRPVTNALGTSGVTVARQVIGNENKWVPDLLRGEELEEFNRLFPPLRKGNAYPGRARDLARFEQLRAEAEKRYKERRVAVEEAEAVLAGMEKEDEPAAATPAAPKTPTPSKFSPGGFTDKDVYEEYEKARERLEYEYGPPLDRRPFKVRFEQARRKAPPTLLKADYPESVWQYGREKGLFAPREESLVLGTMDEARREKAAEQTKRDKMRAAQQQEQQFRSFRSGLNLMFIQGALMGGPKAPPIVRVPYISYGTAHTGVELYRGIESGSPTQIVGATLPLVAGYTFHRMGGRPEPAPIPRRPGTGRLAPEEVTPDQVRALYRAEPDAVKKNLSNAFHQSVWEQHGGQGGAPLAFRTGQVMQVNEAQWSRVGKLSEINRPEELIGPAARPADPAATARTLPAADPAATARTLPDPRARTVPDPHARTVPAAEPPAAGAPAAQRPETQPSVPSPARAPARPRQAMRRATALRPEDAVTAYRSNPGSIHRSVSHDWHEQAWRMDRGQGDVPLAFRSGNRILVDVELWPPDLLGEIGLSMRLP
jgi:hypothetical protein